MKSLDTDKNSPLLGIAYSDYIVDFSKRNGNAFDYIEVPLELLNHNGKIFEVSELKPIILHCASLSIAGSIPPERSTIESINFWANKTQTPWIGEHLSYITAPSENSIRYADEYAPGQPYNIGYTMPPPLNEGALISVRNSIDNAKKSFPIPVILENPPIYFRIPGSEMSQIDFINEVVKNSDVGLLLDLAHFLITSKNEGFDPLISIKELPLEKVVEIHISGIEHHDGTYWDHHASGAPDIEYDLLAIVLNNAKPKAITLEFNWNSKFPEELLSNEISKVRRVINNGAINKQ